MTSACTAMPPSASATAVPASRFMSTMTTFAPSDATRSAVALPMPLPPPVMTTVRPVYLST